MGSNPSYFQHGDNYLVEKVSWNDIVGTSGATMTISGMTYYEDGFIYKLNQLTGKHYRLPTEAEWEYAARGGSHWTNYYIYSGSNNVGDVAWYQGNSFKHTYEVGTKSANQLGIHDMSGNVWEWVYDWYGTYTSTSQTNPTGQTFGSYRVFRGGCWYDYGSNCRVAYRSNYWPGYSYDNVGFRLVLVP
jgi:formylglycine-generating enzyme required for sulfatase activity